MLVEKKIIYFLLILLMTSILTGQVVMKIDSKELQKTVITPHMEAEIQQGQNIIYCSTFQLAWNDFRDSFSMYLSDEPEVIELLDKKLSSKEDISEDCYVAMTGQGKEIVERINEALKEKFKDEAWLLEESHIFENHPDPSFLAYAFLYKNLIFQEEFEGLDEPIYFQSNGESVKVKAFGIKEFSPDKEKHQNFGKQVSVLFYDFGKTGFNFIIKLTSNLPDDEIIPAKIEPKETLLETIKSVNECIKNANPRGLGHGDVLKIPKLDYDIGHSYPDIEKYLGILAEGPAKAYQGIRFKLNEKGAIIKSEAILLMEGEIRSFVFDRPFLIYLKQKDAKYPYFAMWIDNTELMLKQ